MDDLSFILSYLQAHPEVAHSLLAQSEGGNPVLGNATFTPPPPAEAASVGNEPPYVPAGTNQTGSPLGTYGTAAMVLGHSLPQLVEMFRPRQGFAPAAHVGDKYQVQIPTGIFPALAQYRSLLASFLKR